MNEQIRWDNSLIKKYSSSNHFKLLNQLRNEVIKYPLNKSNVISTNIRNDITKFDHNINLGHSKSSEDFVSNNNSNKETNINQSTISFNNSKNFSIYNQNNNQNNNQTIANNLIEENNNSDEYPPMTFKDRLNKIDMK